MIPHLVKVHDTTVMMVNDQPYFAFAGEVHNSSVSNIDYFKNKVLKNIENTNINTLVVPVYFEQIEPEEGIFYFESLKQVIDESRNRGLHLILLWFGLWKNSASTYIPKWMKVDPENYFYVERKDGSKPYIISPLCQQAVEKDAEAFAQLLTFLKEYDVIEQTVIMVQIENEVGCLSTNRDYSNTANEAFEQEIPGEVRSFIGKDGTWKDVIGEDAEEAFMSYHYALAIERIASKGKYVYPLPMYVNAWLAKDHEKPGDYPSGGPNQKNMKWYEAFAPSLDFSAPDLYIDDFKNICDLYAKQGVLAIPETRQDKHHIANVIYGIAAYPLLCFSPFGIEDICNEESMDNDESILSILGISKDSFNPVGTFPYLNKIYGDLKTMLPMLLRYRGTKNIYPFIKEKEQEGISFIIDGFELTIRYLSQDASNLKSAGFIIHSDTSMYVYGTQFLLQWSANVGVLDFEEGEFINGKWSKQRVLNGDERYIMFAGDMPRLFHLVLHTY